MGTIADDGREPDGHASVYEKLRAALVGHAFGPGEHLMIGELADRYGVSPTPVREALSRLRAERLVAFAQGKGYFCPVPDLSELGDLYRALGALLVLAAGASMGRPAADEIERIVAAAEAGEDIDAAPGEAGAAARARAAIVEQALQQVADLCGNLVLSHLAENAIARTHAVRLVDMERAVSFRHFTATLRGLCRAVRRGDREAAAAVVDAALESKTDSLPGLVREIVARPYLAGGAGVAPWAKSA